MNSIENHKLKFDEAVQAEQLKKGKNSRLICYVQYEENVNRLKLWGDNATNRQQSCQKICLVTSRVWWKYSRKTRKTWIELAIC